MPQNFLLKSTNFFDLATFGTDKGHFVKEGNFNYRKLICFSNELNKALTQRFGENQIFAIPYAHQYSIISFHNSLKEFCKSYYYNNHPITETAYNTAIEETSDYIDFYFSTHWDKIISNIIEKIAK